MISRSICAPQVAGSGTCGTCYTKNALKLLIRRYNQNHAKSTGIKINLDSTPKEMLNKLVKKIGTRKSGNIDWIRLPFLTSEDRKYLESFFKSKLRFKGQWLSDRNIEQTLKQYERIYPGFKMFGVFPIDMVPHVSVLDVKALYHDGHRTVALVFNTAPSGSSGEHWICLILKIHARGGDAWFFDSTGTRPDHEIRRLLRQLHNSYKFKVKINKIKHQYALTECGMYCINYILQVLEGKTFEQISNTIYLDFIINKTREKLMIVS